MKVLNTLFVCACSLSASSALAESDWIFGLLATGGENPYVDGEEDISLFPYIAYETERLHIGIDEISYDVVDSDPLEISIVLQPRFSPDFPDTVLFDGLDRDDGLDAGLSLTYQFGDFYADTSVKTDISGASDGSAGKIAVGYEAALGPIFVDVSGGVKLRDEKLNNYLYGVATDEVTAARASFDMDNTANAFAEVSALVPLSDTMFLYGEISYDDLGEAFDSPLVDKKNKTDLALGVIFQF